MKIGASVFDRFDKIVVVNLAERTDRRRDTEAELLRIGCSSAEFFPALKPETAGDFTSVGTRGCYLSHLAILKSAIGLGNLLVLEDDVRFVKDFARRSRIFDDLPTIWQIFYAGYLRVSDGINSSVANPPKCELVELAPKIEVMASHFYAVNGSAIAELVDSYERFLLRPRDHPQGGPMPIDGALNIARLQKSLKTYAAIPPLADQRSSRSDVAQLRWFDRALGVRDVAAKLRSLKNARGRS